MLPTRIRPAGAALLAAACLLLPGVGRPDDTPKAPPPRPAKTPPDAAKEWEAKFAGRSPDEIIGVLNQFAREWTARKGGVEVARQRLNAQTREATKLRLQHGGLKAPDAKSPLVLHRAADMDAAIKVSQQVAEYHAARLQLLEAVRTTREALNARSREFDRAAIEAQDHLTAMQEASRVAKGILADKLPPALDPKRLTDEASQLKTVSSEAATASLTARTELGLLEGRLADAKSAAEEAAAQLNELKAGREATLAAFAFEDQVKAMNPAQLVDEFAKLRKLLAEKTAAIKGDADDYAKTLPGTTEARAKLEAINEPFPPVEEPGKPTGTPLEQAANHLVVVQQHLAARVRTIDERAEKIAALVAALDEQEKKALAYFTTLEDARRMAGQLAVIAAEIARRVGRGDLDVAKVPEGVAEAAQSRPDLATEATSVQHALATLKAEREALRKPDPETESLKSLTTAVLTHVSERLDRLTDLKKLAADYATARKDRPDGEQKRLDQRAVERMAKEAAPWDHFLALDHSKAAADTSELLAAYYKELIDLDERDENLKRQQELLNKAVELTRKEAADIAKLRAVLEKRPPHTETAHWDAWLAWRLAPGGLKTEAGVYHDEQARLTAVGGANARRVQALTGNAPPDSTKQPAGGGEIGQARGELFEARVRGLGITGIKIAIVLLAALIIPRVLMFVLRRSIRGTTDAAGNPSPGLSVLRRVLKAGTWIAALALILSVLGYDVMALVIALAIGALAIALAARPMIADVLGAVVIFAERRFQVGDVVRLGSEEPARVVGLTWRSTALKNPNGLVFSVPNRKVTETTVENLSRAGETYDALSVTISTDKDAGKVIGVIRAALAQCKNLAADQGVTVVKYNQKGNVKVVEYRFWWFLKDYDARNKTRDEVFARIAVGLAQEDMSGIEVTLA